MEAYVQTSLTIEAIELLDYTFSVNGFIEVFWTNSNVTRQLHY